jgi:hypothetical protein
LSGEPVITHIKDNTRIVVYRNIMDTYIVLFPIAIISTALLVRRMYALCEKAENIDEILPSESDEDSDVSSETTDSGEVFAAPFSAYNMFTGLYDDSARQ